MSSDNLNSLLVDFSDDEPEDEGGKEEGGNRAFLIGAIALAAVFCIGIALVVYLVVLRPSQAGTKGGAQDNSVELTNQANIATATAMAEAALAEPSATPVEVAEQTEEVQPSNTPTSALETTEEATGEGTEEATEETTSEATEEATGGAGGTSGLGGVATLTSTPTALQPAGTGAATGVATSGILEVTVIGGDVATPTPIVSGTQGGVGGPTISPTTGGGIGGPISPTTQEGGGELPTTGLLDSGSGLAGLGILAVALVAVVIVVRRIRLK